MPVCIKLRTSIGGKMNRLMWLVCAVIICIGMLGAGFYVGRGMYDGAIQFKKVNRSITVKGLAEKDVTADLGIWEISYREIGNDLIQLDQKLAQDQKLVVDFLVGQGFAATEIDKIAPKVEDRLANVYNQSPIGPNDQRYVVTAGCRIRSTKVNLIQQSSQIVDKLLQQGLPLAFDSSGQSPNPSFYYTNLDDIRPIMITNSTRSAYKIATQFAQDTDNQIIGVQRASQGVFQIMGRDTSTLNADWNSNQNALGSIAKKVRLVTTIEYIIQAAAKPKKEVRLYK